MKKIFILMIAVLTTLSGFASDKAGNITSFNGRVQVFDGVSPRGVKVTKPDTEIFIKNRVATKSKSNAVINFANEDKIALGKNSTLLIEGFDNYKPESGKVVFSIQTRGGTRGVDIALKTAVIGVKGTEFLVDADWDANKYNIFLKEGLIECRAKEGKFKKYQDVVMDEYEAYVRKMAGEYEDYIKELEEQYVEYVESFIMEPGMAFNVDGNEVRSLKFTDEIDEAFKLLDVETEKPSEKKETPEEISFMFW